MDTSAIQNVMTSVDNHVETNHDAVQLVTADGPAVPGTTGFCVVYAAARPVLVFVVGLLFFKPKWQTVLRALIAGVDAICAADAPVTSLTATAVVVPGQTDEAGNALPKEQQF